jgi:hypothetical protein
MSRVLDKQYFSAPAWPVHHPVLVIARQGGNDDWAAYICGLGHFNEPTPEDEDFAAEMGVKLTEEQARGFFPSITLRYRQ